MTKLLPRRYSSSSSNFTPVLFIIIAARVRISRHGEHALFKEPRSSEIVIHDVPGAINVEDIVAYHPWAEKVREIPLPYRTNGANERHVYQPADDIINRSLAPGRNYFWRSRHDAPFIASNARR